MFALFSEKIQHQEKNSTTAGRDKSHVCISCKDGFQSLLYAIIEAFGVFVANTFRKQCARVLQFLQMKMGSNTVWHFVWPWPYLFLWFVCRPAMVKSQFSSAESCFHKYESYIFWRHITLAEQEKMWSRISVHFQPFFSAHSVFYRFGIKRTTL